MNATIALAACAPVLAAAVALSISPEEPWTQPELERVTLAIQADVAELRGERFERPVAVRVATKDDFLEYMKKRMAKTETPESIEADENLGKLLGVLPHDMDLVEASIAMVEGQAAGYYDPDGDIFYLMDQFPRGFAPAIIAHELTHALDDQLFGIDQGLEARKDHSDAAHAFHAVVEGSGTTVGNLWTLRNLDQLDVSGLGEMQAEQQAMLGDSPVWLWKPLLGSYLAGSMFLVQAETIMESQVKPVESADIRRAFLEPPLSTEQVLHPEKYWDPEQRDLPRDVTIATGDLPDGWTVATEDTLGEFALAILATPPSKRGVDLSNPMAMIAIEFTNTAAAGWGGDRIVLARNGEQHFLRLATVWDRERDAGEFFATMAAEVGALEAGAEALAAQWGAGKRAKSGAEVRYGEGTQVILDVWAGVERRDLRKVRDALAVSSD